MLTSIAESTVVHIIPDYFSYIYFLQLHGRNNKLLFPLSFILKV